jgi:hypothetical protein
MKVFGWEVRERDCCLEKPTITSPVMDILKSFNYTLVRVNIGNGKIVRKQGQAKASHKYFERVPKGINNKKEESARIWARDLEMG